MNAPRSVLFVPASNARAMAKAPTLACDAVIIDLEDSVPPQDKVRAREAACAALKGGAFDHMVKTIRINGAGSPWYADDVRAAASLGDCTIVLPKIETAEDVRTARTAVLRAGGHNLMWAMIETPMALMGLRNICGVAKDTGLNALIIGPNDLAAALRLPPARARSGMAPHLAMMVAAARAWKLGILDGVYNDTTDAAGFEAEARQGRDLGFDGKTLIHPAQIEPTNRIFSPSEEEIEWARAVVAAFSQTKDPKGAIAVEGVMAEPMHLDLARALLEQAGEIEARQSGDAEPVR